MGLYFTNVQVLRNQFLLTSSITIMFGNVHLLHQVIGLTFTPRPPSTWGGGRGDRGRTGRTTGCHRNTSHFALVVFSCDVVQRLRLFDCTVEKRRRKFGGGLEIIWNLGYYTGAGQCLVFFMPKWEKKIVIYKNDVYLIIIKVLDRHINYINHVGGST